MKSKRYIWLPILLLIYGLTMAIYFGRDIWLSGHKWQVIISVAVDFIVCVLLFIFLRKRARLNSGK